MRVLFTTIMFAFVFQAFSQESIGNTKSGLISAFKNDPDFPYFYESNDGATKGSLIIHFIDVPPKIILTLNFDSEDICVSEIWTTPTSNEYYLFNSVFSGAGWVIEEDSGDFAVYKNNQQPGFKVLKMYNSNGITVNFLVITIKEYYSNRK